MARRTPDSSPPPPASPRWLPIIVGCCLLAAVVAATYAPVVSAGFVWDDDVYVVNNRNLDDLEGLGRIWLEPRSSPQYYPLVFTSFWIERQLGGAGAAVPHAVNIALHAGVALLVWGLLAQLQVPGAFVAALTFAVHPVHVESVAWITERKNVLSAVWYLGSAWLYLVWAGAAGTGGAHRLTGRRWVYAASVVCFLAALLSKTVTATLPAVLLLLVWWKRGRVSGRDVWPLVPFLAMGAALAGVTAWLEVHHVGASGEEWSVPVWGRVLLAGRVVWFYIRSLAWPHPLSFIYPQWTIDAADPVAYLYPAAGLALVVALWWWRGVIGRGPLVAVLAFLVTLVPVLGFFNVYPMRYSFVADHFQYLASIGIIAAVVAALSHGRVRAGRWARPGAWVLATAVVSVLAVTARAETTKFTDLETLWTDTLAKNPGAWIARNNLGNLRVSQGRFGEARELFTAVIVQKPGFAVAHNNLGTAWFRDGRIGEALVSHRRAVALDPTLADAHNNLGVDLANSGRLQEAAEAYRTALRLEPDSEMAHYNLANVLVRLNRLGDAEPHYREAIRLRRDFALARFYLGLNLVAAGREADARALLDDAFRLKPDFAPGYYQLGTVYLQRGDLANAAASFARAIAIKPDYAEAHNNLGTAFLNQDRLDEAVVSYEAAVRLAPRYAMAHNNLGYARERQGRRDAALASYREALRLDPSNATAAANLARVQK